MKKIYLTFLWYFIIHSLSAQDFHQYILEDGAVGNEYEYRETRHSMRMDDNSILLVEHFNSNSQIMGFNMVKLNDKAEYVYSKIFYADELFDPINASTLDFVNYSKVLFFDNPFAENSNVFSCLYINYADDLKIYYKAFFFDNDLNIYEVIDKPMNIHDDNIDVVNYSILLDHNNEYFICAKTQKDTYLLVRMDIYGNIKHHKHTDISIHEYSFYYVSKNNLVVLDEKESKYACLLSIYKENTGSYAGGLRLFTFDKDFNMGPTPSVTSIIQTVINADTKPAHEPHVKSMKDGSILIYTRYWLKFTDKYYFILMKLDKDLNLLNYQTFEDTCFAVESTELGFDNIIELTENDGDVLINWFNWPKSMSMTFVCLDKDLNIKWRKDYGGDNETPFVMPFVFTSSCFELDDNKVSYLCNILDKYYYGTCIIMDYSSMVSVMDNAESLRPYSFYPNPAADVVNIRFSPDVTAEKVEIYGMDGRLYHEQNFNMETVNVNDLSSGVYMMKLLMDNGESFTEKIVIK